MSRGRTARSELRRAAEQALDRSITDSTRWDDHIGRGE